jgi:DNA-binding NtrC family response regulator
VGRRSGSDGDAPGGGAVRPLFASRNAAARALARTLARLALTDLSLLIEGETGTGKSFVAARVHRRSRAGKPFVVVDCGAIPTALLPAELFGHRAGAFTDATRPRQGRLARADAGTLVLDRVDALAVEAQAALLRVLEERAFCPVGTETPRRFSARVVALAQAGLANRVKLGSFRADLYHRLAGYHLALPPLRHRHEDIVPFARATLRRQARGVGRPLVLDGESEELLCAYPWPGNFRELGAVLARAALEAQGNRIGVGQLLLPSGAGAAMVELAGEREATLAELERAYALYVLARHDGNVTRAARALGISRRTFIRWRHD